MTRCLLCISQKVPIPSHRKIGHRLRSGTISTVLDVDLNPEFLATASQHAEHAVRCHRRSQCECRAL